MKISIITPTFNSASTLSDTIESIIKQTHKNVEYIIIDGQSTDGTKNVVDSFRNQLEIKFISEPDDGIYDAMNKGIALASGDIVHILNADDFYADENVLSSVIDTFKRNAQCDAVYGDITYVSKDDKTKITRIWNTGEYSEEKLKHGWIIPHPSLFIKKEIYSSLEKIFNKDYKISADYELILRLLKIQKINVHYIPKSLVYMRTGGTSDKNLKNKITGWLELRKSWKENNLRVPPFFITKRLLSKVMQFK